MKLPVAITLAPAVEMWPQPDEVLQLAEKSRAERADGSPEGAPIVEELGVGQKPVPAPSAAPPARPVKTPGEGRPVRGYGEPRTAPAGSSPPKGSTGSEPKAEDLSRPATAVNKAKDAFASWMAQTNQARAREAESVRAESPAPLDREQCLTFAVGRIADVFGPRFSEVDTYPSRVRLPDEPLMLVDRVLSMEGKALSMQGGRIVTEHDVLPDSWYLDQGHIPAGLAIE